MKSSQHIQFGSATQKIKKGKRSGYNKYINLLVGGLVVKSEVWKEGFEWGFLGSGE